MKHFNQVMKSSPSSTGITKHHIKHIKGQKYIQKSGSIPHEKKKIHHITIEEI